jgi:penicillin-binding protein 1A
MKQFGPSAVIEIAKKMGITSHLDPVYALCLGVSDVTVYEMVGAYSTFVNKGLWTEPVYITRIEDKNGTVLEEKVPRKIEALSEETAYLTLNLLQGVVQFGTSGSLRGRYKLTLPLAGKTGTTQNYSDGWFIGITPNLVAGAWVGNEDRSVHFRSMQYGQGARMALPIYALFLQKCLADKTIDIKQDAFEMPSKPLNVSTDCSTYETQEELN